jgi:hypothetical protein
MPNPTWVYCTESAMGYPLEQMRDHPRSLVHRLVGHLEAGVAAIVNAALLHSQASTRSDRRLTWCQSAEMAWSGEYG